MNRGTRDFISSHLIPQFRETSVENDNYEKEECLGRKKKKINMNNDVR